LEKTKDELSGLQRDSDGTVSAIRIVMAQHGRHLKGDAKFLEDFPRDESANTIIAEASHLPYYLLTRFFNPSPRVLAISKWMIYAEIGLLAGLALGNPIYGVGVAAIGAVAHQIFVPGNKDPWLENSGFWKRFVGNFATWMQYPAV